MDLPVRKDPRLKEFDYSTPGAYFITICAQDRKRIFSEIVGDGFPVPKVFGTIAEDFIKQIPIKYNTVIVDKYIIMPDHIHMLLRFDAKDGTGDPSPTLGNVVGWYKYQVTKQIHLQCNTKHEKIFQRSYYEHVVRNPQDYDEIWEYIENNPKQWALDHLYAEE